MGLVRRLALLLPLVLLLAAPAQGGRLFDDAADDDLHATGVPKDGTPMSMGVTVAIDNLAHSSDGENHTLLGTFTAVDADYQSISVFRTGAGTPDKPFSSSWDFPDLGYAVATSAAVENQWHCVVGVFDTATARNVYLDGASKGLDSTDITVTGTDITWIGGQADTPSGHLSGTIGEAWAYGDSLVDREARALAAGAWPPYVDFGQLSMFVLLGQGSPEHDVVGGLSFVVNGATKVGHKNPRPWPGMQQ